MSAVAACAIERIDECGPRELASLARLYAEAIAGGRIGAQPDLFAAIAAEAPGLRLHVRDPAQPWATLSRAAEAALADEARAVAADATAADAGGERARPSVSGVGGDSPPQPRGSVGGQVSSSDEPNTAFRGSIDGDELMNLMEATGELPYAHLATDIVRKHKLEQFMSEADEDGDGTLDINEFLLLFYRLREMREERERKAEEKAKAKKANLKNSSVKMKEFMKSSKVKKQEEEEALAEVAGSEGGDRFAETVIKFLGTYERSKHSSDGQVPDKDEALQAVMEEKEYEEWSRMIAGFGK